MIIENIRVYGILDAIRGMRNPLNSWAKNDTTCEFDPNTGSVVSVKFGPNDTKLCKALTTGGQPHRKFLRQISVIMDITAPTYWWAEMDTYKIATTRNSCSVQHKGSSRDFTTDDFTIECMGNESPEPTVLDKTDFQKIFFDAKTIIDIVNRWRKAYVDTKDYTYFRLMRQFLPMGYNYKATWTANYETLLNIYEWRRNHKLKEWHKLCHVIESLPGMDMFIDAIKKPTSTNP